MRITARVSNHPSRHEVTLATDSREQRLAIPPKRAGRGSEVNGGEVMCLAIATSFCNVLFREAAARGVSVDSVEVEVESEFGLAEPARSLKYRVRVSGASDDATLREIAKRADTIAEVHNTLRAGIAVELADVTVSKSMP